MSTRKEVALVIGASRGIGRQVAIELAKNGYTGICGTLFKTRSVLTFSFLYQWWLQQSPLVMLTV
jgi:hypothetical protein